MKRILPVLFSTWLLLSLSGCSGTETAMTAEDIQAQLEAFAEQIPSAEANNIQLTQAGEGYSASFDLTWTKEAGRFSTEKALETYSQELVSNVALRAPSISSVSISWMVPYHSEIEPTMAFSYAKKENRLEQEELQDRLTDGTFGADPYLGPSAKKAASGSSDTNTTFSIETYGMSVEALEGLHLPHHKTVVIPVSYEPRHKTLITPKSYAPRHKTTPGVSVQNTDNTAAAADQQ